MKKNETSIVYKKIYEHYNGDLHYKEFINDIKKKYSQNNTTFNNYIRDHFNDSGKDIQELVNLLRQNHNLENNNNIVDLTTPNTETENLKVAYKFYPKNLEIKKYIYGEKEKPNKKIIYPQDNPTEINPNYLYESKRDILRLFRVNIDNIVSDLKESMNNPSLIKKIDKNIENYKEKLSKEKISTIFSDFSLEDELFEELFLLLKPIEGNKLKIKSEKTLKVKK